MNRRDETILGGRELDALLRTLPTKLQRNVSTSALRAGAAVAMAEVKQNIPVDSGALRKSVRITTRSRNGQVSASVKIGNKTAWYAALVEYGTRPHTIEPEQYAGAMQVDGSYVRSVEHPGARARPYARPAADTKLPEIVAAVKRKYRQRLTEQGLNVPDNIPMGGDE